MTGPARQAPPGARPSREGREGGPPEEPVAPHRPPSRVGRWRHRATGARDGWSLPPANGWRYRIPLTGPLALFVCTSASAELHFVDDARADILISYVVFSLPERIVPSRTESLCAPRPQRPAREPCPPGSPRLEKHRTRAPVHRSLTRVPPCRRRVESEETGSIAPPRPWTLNSAIGSAELASRRATADSSQGFTLSRTSCAAHLAGRGVARRHRNARPYAQRSVKPRAGGGL